MAGAALHGLVLKHLEHLGVEPQLVRSLHSLMQGKEDRAQGSDLYALYSFAADGQLEVRVSNLAGHLCTLRAGAGITVRELKTLVEQNTGILVHEQVLVHNGVQMKDPDSLFSHGVTPVDPLITVLRVRPPKIYIAGGQGENDEVLASMDIFDPARGSWQHGPAMHTARSNCVSAVIGSKLYVIGGESASGDILTDAERFDPQVGAWEQLPSMGTPRSGFSAAILDGKLYVFGGYGDDDVLSSVEVYDPGLASWSYIPSMIFARALSASIAVGGKLFVIGGKNEDDDALNVCEMFDPITTTWNVCQPMPTARYALRLANLDAAIYAFGGFDHEASDVTEVLAPADNLASNGYGSGVAYPALRWQQRPRMFVPRIRFASAILDGQLYSLGGTDGDEAWANCDAFDPTRCIWTKLCPMQEPRIDASLVSDNSRLYILGGHDCRQTLRSAEFFDVKTGAWAAFAPLPAPRQKAAAAVLEREDYVIGW